MTTKSSPAAPSRQPKARRAAAKPLPPTFADRHAAAAFTRLLAGQPLLEPLQGGYYGPWKGALHLVAVAFAAGGQPAAAAKFAQIARRRPALKCLLAQCAEEGGKPDKLRLADLLADPPPGPQPVVPGVVDAGGLTLLAGRPRTGKSWLALQFALAAASGSDLRDGKRKGLFLALEDPPWRLQRRLYQLGARRSLPLHFAAGWPLLDGGGLQCLADELAHGFRLVVIDTLTAALSGACLAWPDRIVHVLGRLQTLAAAHNAAILLIDRHRYPAAYAPYDNVDLAFAIADRLGLFAKTITLTRSFGDVGATLHLSDLSRPIYLARHPDIRQDPAETTAGITA